MSRRPYIAFGLSEGVAEPWPETFLKHKHTLIIVRSVGVNSQWTDQLFTWMWGGDSYPAVHAIRPQFDVKPLRLTMLRTRTFSRSSCNEHTKQTVEKSHNWLERKSRSKLVFCFEDHCFQNNTHAFQMLWKWTALRFWGMLQLRNWWRNCFSFLSRLLFPTLNIQSTSRTVMFFKMYLAEIDVTSVRQNYPTCVWSTVSVNNVKYTVRDVLYSEKIPLFLQVQYIFIIDTLW